MFQNLQRARGPIAKAKLLRQRFSILSAREGEYVVKILTGDLRIGLREGLVEEAIAKAFDASLEEVKQGNMPGLNGAEVLRRLRSDEDAMVAQIPAIMLTAHGSEQSEVSCLQAGADDFVTKPVNASVLRARIETQLRLRLMRRQLEQQNDELEKWRRELERDLAAARLTQQSLIPQKPLLLPGWQIATCYHPVIQVGGDIYGWLRMKDGRVLFWIADGTGHGASAALLTTLAKLLFHYGSMDHDSPASLMEGVDNDFRSIFGATSFMCPGLTK